MFVAIFDTSKTNFKLIILKKKQIVFSFLVSFAPVKKQ